MDFFGNIISSYTDRDAVEDGEIFPIVGPVVHGYVVNRVTAPVWWDYTDYGPDGPHDERKNVTRLTQLFEKIIAWGKFKKEWTTLEEATRTFWVVPNGGRTSKGYPTATLMYKEDY